MADPYVREIGRLTEIDGMYVSIGVDYDSVTVQVGGVKATLTQPHAEEFAQLFVSACWQAGAQARQMAEETWDTMHEVDHSGRIGGQAVSVQTGRRTDGTRVLAQQDGITALLDPDCRDGKHTSCVGPPCECGCHVSP